MVSEKHVAKRKNESIVSEPPLSPGLGWNPKNECVVG